ncbi:armadillo-type protein [Zychaea mexicana]|uniref:armadillo-type protein n=1 Tax=Zychaea mexicana TaxID=64656 RepID=UPI0022FECC3C|nr:armadillo-type protein [Zychaea mexicana]KAI9488175.1 armadillo-type protein [Zychaea mexicana]
MQQLDDRPPFLLPRPVWVNDIDVIHCTSCNAAFGPLRRRHHCRHCGNIFCHECSSKSVPLPQLGYGSKPVRVCKGCFEVAYLVTYAIDDDHGLSTQIHGTRGLLELIEKDNEHDLQNVVMYGGIDALIWLCWSSTSVQIHHLATTTLAILAEKESIRPVIITKWALPPLLHLIEFYVYYEINTSKKKKLKKKGKAAATVRDNDENVKEEDDDDNDTPQEVILEIVINCTHVFYQLSRAGIFSQSNIIDDGVLYTLLTLAAYDPVPQDHEKKKQQNGQQPNGGDMNGNGQEEEEARAAIAEQFKERVRIIQSLAAKAVSAISAPVTNQPSVIELIRGTDKFAYLLRSTNGEVRKYMAKTIAYLSLRNDKYKPALLGGDVARALVSIIALLPHTQQQQQVEEGGDDDDIDAMEQRKQDHSYYLSRNDVDEDQYGPANSSAVSHACCALANFATNNESQSNLISQPRVLKYICNVPAALSGHTEVHRHVARCLANFALYSENNAIMLGYAAVEQEEQNNNTSKKKEKGTTTRRRGDPYNVLSTLLAMGQSANATPDIQRHIVRAIDNLSSQVSGGERWRELFKDAHEFILRIMDESEDSDTLKRAQSIHEKSGQGYDSSNTTTTTTDTTLTKTAASTTHKKKTKKKNKKKNNNDEALSQDHQLPGDNHTT